MSSSKPRAGYNERLFSGGVRSFFHFARFHWLKRELQRIGCAGAAVFELGCFDGKTIEWLPKKPSRYLGCDANWEGGLDLARRKYRDHPEYQFVEATGPNDIECDEHTLFDLAIAMETLEHVAPDIVAAYLAKIDRHLQGYFLVTVPNEKGAVFLVKYLIKKILLRDDYQRYTPAELLNAALGRMQHVSRNEHKGFDWERMVTQIAEYFEVVGVNGLPFGKLLPPYLCFSIGILARTRTGKGDFGRAKR